MRFIVLLWLLVVDAACALTTPEEPPWEAHPRTVDYAWSSALEWGEQHESFVKQAGEGNIEVLLLGDSITEGWDAAPDIWNAHFAGYRMANFGISGDATQNLLWRITAGGELNGLSPRAVVLLIGTNNLDMYNDSPEDTARGVGAIVQALRETLPDSRVLLLGIFPRGATRDTELRQRIEQTNRAIARLADGEAVRYLDIGPRLVGANGELHPEIMPDAVHLSPLGYALWAAAMQTELEALIRD